MIGLRLGEEGAEIGRLYRPQMLAGRGQADEHSGGEWHPGTNMRA